MVILINNQRNVNSKSYRYTMILTNFDLTISSVSEDIRQQRFEYAVGGNIHKLVQPLGKQFGISKQN